ncbi:ABC transporter ATP-binding protein [Spiroplasma chinense]|uniref:ABC transporter ATP-binding protein n=1 Tax=Spiroplasma chinense TaxID=216932 RepID=A0A5B9Y4M5_9MOLU|nr:ATP-binding cassette domain-containing protein [Spiroplasma chinense]QEH62118.1 ABC transporter ATP-binding protein [Spiroplasma chinense]
MTQIININKQISDIFTLEIKNLKIEEGQIIALVGSNGSGKTTFIKTISQNFIYQKNTDIDLTSTYDVLQQVSNYGSVKLFDIALLLKNLYKKKTDLNKLFGFYELNNHKLKYFSNLSPGQQQRYKFMLLELLSGDILILDETFNFLDTFWRRKITKRIQSKIDQYKNVFIIDHNLETLKELCNRMIFLKGGKILEDTKNIKDIEQEKFDELVGSIELEPDFEE